jgi:hypothetical protein
MKKENTFRSSFNFTNSNISNISSGSKNIIKNHQLFKKFGIFSRSDYSDKLVTSDSKIFSSSPSLIHIPKIPLPNRLMFNSKLDTTNSNDLHNNNSSNDSSALHNNLFNTSKDGKFLERTNSSSKLLGTVGTIRTKKNKHRNKQSTARNSNYQEQEYALSIIENYAREVSL